MTTAALCSLALLAPLRQDGQEAYAPFVAPASAEPRGALVRMEVPEGFEVSLWAAEPRLANPVCLYVDHGGDVYVGETFRHHAGVTDIREHMDWLDDDLACRTVEDRVAMFQEQLGERFGEYQTERERVRLLRDTDGDGAADFDTDFADRFGEAADGIGAGLLSWRGEVFYTCIPSLWRLRDSDGDGRAESQERLSTGYGIRVALLGHDLHGLRVGPDGRLYFSCGDRGFAVQTREGQQIEHWHTGAVLRCEPDGAGLEVFATGLRNPQELAFDEFGDLFTGDNNSDGGDRARIVHVIEGADSGWRQAYQWLVEPQLRGPWNAEFMWRPPREDQPAYIVPPVDNLADGPSGFTYYPGTGFGEPWKGHFFLVDFRGGAGSSGVHAFTLEERGASFALGRTQHFLWKLLATDADFGPDGALWACDWVDGWNKTGKGRIWRVTSQAERKSELVRQTARLLAEGLDRRSSRELAQLLGHADQRVRQEAHLELAVRGEAGADLLAEAAHGASDLHARLHGLWGLGVVARRSDPRWSEALLPLLDDFELEVRANASRVLGDLREPVAVPALEARLEDESPRVRLLSAIALSRIGSPRSVEPLIALLREDGGKDAALRHAAALGLSRCAEPGRLVALIADPSSEVRLGAVVALRRLRHLGLIPFLSDSDPRVALEAARAVYDLPIASALPALAARIDRPGLEGDALVRRILCANWRLGGADRAQALARFALDSGQGQLLRTEALDLLALWSGPAGRDPFTGEWLPLERGASEVRQAQTYLPRLVRELSAGLIGDVPEHVALAWLELVRRHDAGAEAARMSAWALERERSPRLRAAAVGVLGEARPEDLVATLRALVLDPEEEVRAAVVAVLAKVAPEEALPVIEDALARGGIGELRAAYTALSALESPEADARLAAELQRLEAELVPEEVALDLVLAAERRDAPGIQELLTSRSDRRALDPSLAPWLDALHGGDADRGRRLFLESSELACVRCHAVAPVRGDTDSAYAPEGLAGGQVGPDLRGVARRLSRLGLLESIVEPNRRIAEGWRETQLILDDDTLVAGLLVGEAGGVVSLRDAQDELLEIPVEQIVERREGLSAMPQGAAQYLSRARMRDLIEFLGRL